MGFFSWTCAKTNLPIMNSCSGNDKDQFEVVLLRPDNPLVIGTYDGYGRLLTDDGDIDLRDLCVNAKGQFTCDLQKAKLVLKKFWEGETYSEIKGKSNSDPGQGHFHDQQLVDLWYKMGGFKTYRNYVKAFNTSPEI